MLPENLLAAVEQDLTVARQLAYFYVGYSPDGQDMEVEPELFARGASSPSLAHNQKNSPSKNPSSTTAAAAINAATHIRIALSNPVQRPREGTCVVLMELTRPLTWLSQRGRARGPSTGARSTVNDIGQGAAQSFGHPLSRNASHAGSVLSSTNATTGGPAMTSSIGGVSGGSVHPTPQSAITTSLPLLVATATLEVVFPACYPCEPCQWNLSEAIAFGSFGDHSTSSWAVPSMRRSQPHSSSPTDGTLDGAVAERRWGGTVRRAEDMPRGSISSRLLFANTTSEVGATSTAAATVAAAANKATSFTGELSEDGQQQQQRLRAFIVPTLGRLLLRWIVDARAKLSDTAPSSLSNVVAAAPSSLSGATPFLLDFACLLRSWTAVELDVRHLLLPSRITMAYGGGGGGGRLLRTMAGTHLSGGGVGGNGGAAVGVGGSSNGSGGAGLLPTSTQGTTTASPLSVSSSSGMNVAGGGVGTSHPGAASSASMAAPTGAATNNGGGNAVLVGGGPNVSALYPHRRRAVRHFLALLLPQGDVAVCGSCRPPVRTVNVFPSLALKNKGAGEEGGGGGGGGGGNAVAESQLASRGAALSEQRMPPCLLAIYAPLQPSLFAHTTEKEPPLHQEGARGAVFDADAPSSMLRHSSPFSSPDPARRRHPPLPGTIVACTSQFSRGKVLPSYLLPSHLLGSAYKCTWADVRLFTGRSADAALHANAKLAKALRLPDVSDLLQLLRRLSIKGSSGGAASGANTAAAAVGSLYVDGLLWPALMEVVGVLREARRPLWAGIAICATLLPSVQAQDENPQAQQHSGSHSSSGGRQTGILYHSPSSIAEKNSVSTHERRRWLQEMAVLLAVVGFTERVFAVAQEPVLFCEARHVRRSLEEGLLRLHAASSLRGESAPMTTAVAPEHGQLHQPLSSASAPEARHRTRRSSAGANPYPGPVSPVELCKRVHAPLSICAVCGLSLLRNTVKQEEAVHAGFSKHESRGAASANARTAAALRRRRAEGCLIVQCARCGHGGHVEHMSSWWTDPTVHCCPKGCDCICEY